MRPVLRRMRTALELRGQDMESFHWHEERERIREEALRTHRRRHRLFKEDRFAFELERRKAIRQVIDSAPDPELRKKLEALQESWDKKMRHAGSSHNRFVLAQALFWDHFLHRWLPAIRQINEDLNGDGAPS